MVHVQVWGMGRLPKIFSYVLERKEAIFELG